MVICMVSITNKNVVEVLRKGMGFNPFYSEGKKFQPSFIIMGDKGSGKTFATITTFTGTMLILSMDNQTEIILEDIIKQEKKKYGKSPTGDRVLVMNFFPSEYGHIGGTGDERRLNVGNAIIKDIEKLFDNMRTHNIHFDHIVIDGFPELKDRINEYMRKVSGLTFTERILGEDMIAWGYRNRFFQLLVSSMFELSDVCPVFTTYPKADLSKVFKGKTPMEPEFDKNLKWEFRNIIQIHRVVSDGKKKNSYRYYAVYDSMKGTDFGEQGDEIEITGGRPAIPPEKLEAYRKGNPMNTITVPQIEISREIDLPEIELPDMDGNTNTTDTNTSDAMEKEKSQTDKAKMETKDEKYIDGNGEKDKTTPNGGSDGDMSFLDDL